MTPEQIAERIETARCQLDAALALSLPQAPYKILLGADVLLRKLKRDIGYPNAGLPSKPAPGETRNCCCHDHGPHQVHCIQCPTHGIGVP
jgi:hypothetical protein